MFWWVGAMLSKFLIQFSVDGRGCVPSLLFDLSPNYGGGNEDNGYCACTVGPVHALPHSLPPTLQQGTADPCLCWKFWVSLLWGRCSFLLGSGVHKVLFVPSSSLFPQSCGSSGSSMVGLMVTSFERVLPYPDLLHPEPLPLRQDTADPYLRRRQSKAFLAQFLWDIWDLVCPSFILAL